MSDYAALSIALQAINVDESTRITAYPAATDVQNPGDTQSIAWDAVWSIECDASGDWYLVGTGSAGAGGWGKCEVSYPISDQADWPIRLELDIETVDATDTTFYYARSLERDSVVILAADGPIPPHSDTLRDYANALRSAADHLTNAADWKPSNVEEYTPEDGIGEAEVLVRDVLQFIETL